MFKVHTTGRYLVKNGENIVVEDRLYSPEELNGCKCLAGVVLLKDLETGKSLVVAPGKKMKFDTAPELTKDDLLALMPDRKFKKKVTRAELLEAYNGN